MIVYSQGFDLICLRKEKVDIKSLEEEYNIILPPIYRVFAEIFDLNKFKRAEFFLQNDKLIPFTMTYLSKEGNDISFDGFSKINDVFQYHDNDDDWLEAGHLPIGGCSHGGAILLGTKGSEIDKIILQDMAGDLHELSENIFDFAKDISYCIYEDNLEKINLNDLYKNWGEDFWRVRNAS